MASDPPSCVKFEIGHVLFIDIVGYSKLLINEQTEQIRKLMDIVRGTGQFRAAEAAGKLVRLPTGDGGALVFRDDPQAPIRCAIEISKALKDHPKLHVRMGIHSGPVNDVADLNDQANIAGAGVNIAQRVMDCGDNGHILLSKRVADDLAPYPEWNRYLHALGEIEVKHGEKIGLVNFFTDDAGNPEQPRKCQKSKPAPVVTRYRLPVTVAAVALIAVSVMAWLLLSRHQPAKAPANASAPSTIPVSSKSIAVLPFENLSEDKANAFFADGVQDEILTNLSKIADLKVISRSSVMQYRTGAARNLREIGKQLGVDHLLEGSVQRAGPKVRVNAQLIDARTDAHVWAQTYDRDLADVFSIQSEIAREIAGQLQAKLAPEEKSRLAAKPTNNTEAYLLYLQANDVVRVAASKQEAVEADILYDKAISLDPSFALAYARASMQNSLMYMVGREDARKAKARSLAESSLRLDPGLGEGHLALGLCYYRIDADYEKASQELAIAGRALPNNSEILNATGLIYRRQNRWREALALFDRAKSLDPNRAQFETRAATLSVLRQWRESLAEYSHGLELERNRLPGWIGLAYVQFCQTGDPSVASAVLSRLPDALKNKPDAMIARWDYMMMARDFTTAEQVCPDPPPEEFRVFQPRAFFRGCIAHAKGDQAEARSLLEQVTPPTESFVSSHPDDPRLHARLSAVYSMLGRKEDAIREARRAIELCPESRDAVSGAGYAANLAFVYAQTGETDQAITLLSRLLTTPAAERITLAHLRLSWEWDPLRKDPRFQKLLADPEPKTEYK